MPKLAHVQSRPQVRSTEPAPEHHRGHGTPAASGSSGTLPLFLQRVPGAVVQAKRVVNEPNDMFEQEADALSELVELGGGPDLMQPKAPAPPSTDPVIEPPDPGMALNDDVRARVEPMLGMDLSDVRVHDSPVARAEAQALRARAFTHKNHIWLGPDERADDTKLLAHEATHVLHQSEGLSGGAAAGAGDTAGAAPPIQRTGESSSLLETPMSASPDVSLDASAAGDARTSPESDAVSRQRGDSSQTMASEAADVAAEEQSEEQSEEEANEGADGGTQEGEPAEQGEAQAEAQVEGEGEAAGGGAGEGGGSGEGGGGGRGPAVSGEGGGTAPPVVEETGAGTLETGDLVLIDVELAEHQRWAGALGRVGEAGSLQRAEFVAEAAGSGFISGAASGLAMGLGIGLVSRAVPAIGPVIGGAMALHGLVSRDWSETGATIARFGEGNSTYEMLANTIASVAAVIDVVSQVLTVINGIVGIVQIAAAVIAGGAVVAAFFTFGATLGIAAIAADVVAVCEEISLGINAVTAVLDTVNAAILQPCVTLFRALHAFTTQADPREVEAQGRGISTAASASGAALGAWAGGRAAQIGAGGAHPAEDLPPSQRTPGDTPPPAAGDGPTVRFEEPPAPVAHAEGTALPVAPDVAIPLPVAPDVATPLPVASDVGTPLPVAPDVVTSPPVAQPEVVTPAPTSAPEVAATAPVPPAETVSSSTPTEAVATPPPQGTVPADIDTPPPGWEAPPPGFVPDEPALGGNWPYNEPVPDRASLGHNVQRDHVIAQAKLRDILTDPTTGQVHYPPEVRDSLTVLAETGAATPDRPALPHTEVTFHGPDADVPQIDRLRAQGGPGSFTDDIVGPSRDARIAAGYDPQAVDRGWVDQLGRLGATQRMGDTGGHVERLSGGQPLTDADVEGLNWSSFDLGPAPTAALSPDTSTPTATVAPPVSPVVPDVVSPATAVASPESSGSLTTAVSPPTATPDTSAAPPAPPQTAEGGTPPPQRILVVGAERAEEFQYAREMAALGRDVTVVNPQATPESEAFAASGGNFVQAGIETLPQQPGYNVVSEDFPVPVRRYFPQAQAQATERISRLEPGGRWVVTTESAEYVQMLEVVGRMQGAVVTAHQIPRHHEATPDSPHVVESTRFIVTVERPRASAATPETPTPTPSTPPAPVTPPTAPRTPTAPPTSTASPTPRPTTEPPVATSRPPSTFSAAAGAARTAVAQQTPGSPQPGTGEVSWGTRAHQVGELFLPQIFGGGGPAPTYEQQQAAHRARFTEDNQPAEGVERVNPDYPSPPATPAQITAIQNEIMNLLTVRAAAEQEAQTQQGRAEQCEENQGPIQQTVDDTTAGIAAVQAHDAAVARREAVNQEQQQRQQESQGLVAGYPSRATGLVALTVPLAAWEGFTSLASHLPGEAGDSMMRMNQEAREMQAAFDQMGAEMLGVETQGPAREGELQDDQGRLEATGELAAASDQQLHTASTGADGLQQANEAALAEARQREEAATGREQECSEAVAEREARADSLAEQLRAWAAAHAGARQQAIAATEARLEGEGRIVVESSER